MEFLLHMEYFVYNGSTQCREKAKDGLWSRPFYSLDRQYLTCVRVSTIIVIIIITIIIIIVIYSAPWRDLCVCVHNYCPHLCHHYY